MVLVECLDLSDEVEAEAADVTAEPEGIEVDVDVETLAKEEADKLRKRRLGAGEREAAFKTTSNTRGFDALYRNSSYVCS